MTKKGKDTPEKEIEEAAERLRQKPEHLTAAQDSQTWIDFLHNQDIYPEDTDKKSAFFEKVREEVNLQEVGFTPKELDELNVTATAKRIYRDAKGHFTKEKTDKFTERIQYRENETNKFTSREKLELRSQLGKK